MSASNALILDRMTCNTQMAHVDQPQMKQDMQHKMYKLVIKMIVYLLAAPNVRAKVVLMLIDMAASTSLALSGFLSSPSSRPWISAWTERTAASVLFSSPSELVGNWCLARVCS